jgi:tetratricopeptide (TPR) repeat protein
VAHLKWGIVKEYDGDLTAALNEFDTALRLAPSFTVALNSKGMILNRLNRPDQAIDCFRHAVELDPAYAEARVNYGDALLFRGDEQGALSQYSEAAARRPDNTQAQFKLANMLLTQIKRPDLAIPHYLAAVSDDPTRADIRLNLAVALFATGQFGPARQQCQIALQLDPNLSQAKQLWIKLSSVP